MTEATYKILGSIMGIILLPLALVVALIIKSLWPWLLASETSFQYIYRSIVTFFPAAVLLIVLLIYTENIEGD